MLVGVRRLLVYGLGQVVGRTAAHPSQLTRLAGGLAGCLALPPGWPPKKALHEGSDGSWKAKHIPKAE